MDDSTWTSVRSMLSTSLLGGMFWCSFVSHKSRRIGRLWQLCRNEIENKSTCRFLAWPVAIDGNENWCRYADWRPNLYHQIKWVSSLVAVPNDLPLPPAWKRKSWTITKPLKYRREVLHQYRWSTHTQTHTQTHTHLYIYTYIHTYIHTHVIKMIKYVVYVVKCTCTRHVCIFGQWGFNLKDLANPRCRSRGNPWSSRCHKRSRRMVMDLQRWVRRNALIYCRGRSWY